MDGSAFYRTPDEVDDTDPLTIETVTSELETAVNALPDYSCEVVGNVLKVKRLDMRSFNLAVKGGVTARAMTAVKGRAQDISQLPSQCFDGFSLEVVNTNDSDADDYYVKFKAAKPGIPGAGAWEETVAPGISLGLNNQSMPHALIRQDDGTFTFGPLSTDDAFEGWAKREIGDDNTNPDPTFVGETIEEMFFYQNRLGFLSADSVILSQPGDYFNFYKTSALAVSDADPIDMVASSLRPAFLKYAVGTPKGLLLFAENAQFLLSSQDLVFAPATVKMREISDYHFNSDAPVINSGISVMFPSESNTNTKIFEMAVDSVENRPQVADITRAVPEFVPTGLRFADSSTNNSFAAWGDMSNTLYTFKYFNQGDERVVAGWGKWTFETDIKQVIFDRDSAFLVSYNTTSKAYSLLMMDLQDDPYRAPVVMPWGNFLPRIDYQRNQDNVTINGGKITFNQHQYPNSGTVLLMCTEGDNKGYFLRPDVVDEGSNTFSVTVDPDIASSKFVIGVQYLSLIHI